MIKNLLNIALLLSTTGVVNAQNGLCFNNLTGNTYFAGNTPKSIITSDFNGDGKADLAVANENGNNVSILLGSGTGTFAAAVNYGVGLNPYSLTSADFNGDGKVDLATANYGGNNVSILLGSGTGTFAAAVNYNIGSNPFSVISADFNGDGKADLATANGFVDNVSILLGSGTGTFATAVNYNVGSGPISVISTDFNGDGKADLATANFSGNNASILLGSGTGTFAAAVNYNVGSNPFSVISADFNGDGKADLAMANSNGNDVSILLGSGTGTFATAVNYNVGSNPYAVISNDFNGDGKADLATANAGGNNVSILLGSGTGAFAAAVNYNVGSVPVSVTSTNFNAGSKPDIAVALNAGNQVKILLSDEPTITVNSGTINSGSSFTIVPSGGISYTYAPSGPVVTPTISSNYTVTGSSVSGCTNNAISTVNVNAEALNFDGANDFVNIPNNSSFNFGTNDFTIETYAKTSSVAGNKVMIGKINGGNNYWFGVSNGKANFSLIGGPDALGTSTISDGNWHHLAAVRQSGVVSLYVDGVLEASQNNTGTATINGNLTLGNFNGGFNFPGSLDEVRIWNRALCKGEILNNKNAEISLTQTGLVAYYKFNQGGSGASNSTVTTLTDLSGNANNGTLTNFALSGTTSNWIAPGAVTSGSTASTYTMVSTSVSSQTNVLCNGGSSGSATITTTGGNSPYTYLASTGATVSTLSGLTAGVYSYTVTDANACKAIQTLTITQPSALATSTTVSNVLCNGGSSGSATITITGGNSPYMYLASTGATVSTLSGLTAGAYTYTVTDNNGCVKTQALTVTEPSALAAGTIINPILCNGANDGKLTVVGIQGTAPYTYSWSTGATTSTITNLSPGVYTATVTDANGCLAIATKTLIDPPPVTVTITASSSNICVGSSSTLTASASGGLMGSSYTYSWVAGPTASVCVVSPTTTSVYTVYVADDYNCVKSSTINIVANVCSLAEALSFDGVNDYVYVLNNNSFGFGTNDFTIETWEKTSSTTGNRVMLSKINGASNYWMGVSNGKAIFSMTGGPDVVGTTTIGDGNWHHIAAVRQNGVVSLYVDGVIEASQNNNGNVAIGGNFAFGEFGGGYNFAGSLDEVRIWNSARTKCEINTYKNCEIATDATGLLVNYHFNQGNAAANNAGVVSLTDATSNNITGTLANFALNGTTSNWVAPGGVVSGYTTTAPAPTVTVNSGSICAGQSFTMMPSGADTYSYSGGSDVVMPTSDASYTVTGTDANGCSNTAVSTVTVNPLPSVTANSGNVTTCGDVSADFGIVATGNNNTYEWHFDQVGGSDHGVINGTYTEINFNTDTMTIQQVLTGQYAGYYVYCYVTNEFGCVTRTANDTIVANLTPTITVNSGAICAGQSFTIVPSGASTYTYSGGSDVVMPTTDASYTVTGTDANGCENTAVSSLTVNALPNLTTMTTNTLLCTGETTTLSVMGASTYTWSTTETTTDIAVTPTVQTTYTVEGTDANGCSNTTTITQDVSLCTGVATLSNDASINVYPNPNNGLFTIEVTTASKVTVTNALGQVVIAETFDVGKHSININNESTGVYFVKVMTNNKQQIIKVIKE